MSKKGAGRPRLQRNSHPIWAIGVGEAAEIAGVSRSTIYRWTKPEPGSLAEEYGSFDEDEWFQASPEIKAKFGQMVPVFKKSALRRLGRNALINRNMIQYGLFREESREDFELYGEGFYELPDRPTGYDPVKRRRRIRGYTPMEEAALYGLDAPFASTNASEAEIDAFLGIESLETPNPVMQPGGDPDRQYEWAGSLVPYAFIDKMIKICDDTGLAMELVDEALARLHGNYDPIAISTLVRFRFADYSKTLNSNPNILDDISE